MKEKDLQKSTSPSLPEKAYNGLLLVTYNDYMTYRALGLDNITIAALLFNPTCYNLKHLQDALEEFKKKYGIEEENEEE